MTRPAPKSAMARLWDRQREQARAAMAARQPAADPAPAVKPPPASLPPRPAPGTFRIAELVEGQCRFPVTPHRARPHEHRFCGEPVAWKAGKPTSWCGQHLIEVCGQPGRAPGGASLADMARAPKVSA
ncbi:hypothetical protein [Methylobacterium fujisawaense]